MDSTTGVSGFWPATACVLALGTLFSAGAGALGGTFDLRRGALALTFDEDTGALVRIEHEGTVLAAAPPSGPMRASFAVGPADKVVWLDQLRLKPKLLKRIRPAEGTLELTVRVGDYELAERYVLHAEVPRLDRSAVLVNRGRETVKLRGFSFRTPGVKATPDGFYRFPRQWGAGSRRFADMQPERMRGGGLSIAPLLAQLAPKRTILWAAYADDTPSVHLTEGRDEFQVNQDVQAAGYLRPNEPQSIGFVTMQVVPSGYWGALDALWGWMDSVGLKLPADRADWLRGAVLYSFHPGGTIGSDFRDLGGFRPAAERLLPTLPALGADAVWIMPIEQKSPYWPFDYYKFMDGLGTGEEYRALVARAHKLGLHVLQDLVPHGGSPQAVHNRQHPEFMLRREDGSTLTYWLNDFARPDWQAYVAKVADHYVRRYGVDGYRVDACYGSKEMNWDPKIPYARASLAQLHGGLGMLGRIRSAVKAMKPKDGAILAEVESARHLAVSDAQYDFGFCYNVCQQWRSGPPEQFVAHLQEYLEEQKYDGPRGAVRLRHIESHDSLRSQLWYGVGGMRALYALSAWIDGVPLIYHEMEVGHGPAIARINAIRAARPELARGEAFYRIVKCDQPAVFTCLRKLGDRQSVVAINFGRQGVTANLSWPGGQARLPLRPLEYAVLPPPPAEAQPASQAAQPPGPASQPAQTSGDAVAFPDAREWFVDTLEGRLHDRFIPRRRFGKPGQGSSIYWRPQGTEAVWQSATAPLHPRWARVGALCGDGMWTIVEIPPKTPPPAELRLVERLGDSEGLCLAGLGSLRATVHRLAAPPPEPDVTEAIDVGGVSLRCVGPDYIVANRHYTVVLRRQGGVVRELLGPGGQAAGPLGVLAKDHDLYGDQAYFEHPHARRLQAACDVECGIRAWEASDGLHMSFQGQIRGMDRFALKRPPLWYRNEYVLGDGPRFRQTWAFRTDKPIGDKAAFLASFLTLGSADGFRFTRGGKVLAEDTVLAAGGAARKGQTKGAAPPGRVDFLRDGKRQWSLAELRTPGGRDASGVNVFVHGRLFFLTLLDGAGAAMDAGTWHEFQASWEVGNQAGNQAPAPRPAANRGILR